MNGDDYAQFQARRDEEYRKVYTKWVEGLGEDARKDLERRGLLAPDLGPAVAASREEDAAESREASFTVDMAAMLDDLPEFLMEQMGVSAAHAQVVAAWHRSTVELHGEAYKAWLFNKLVAGFLQSQNPKLSAAGLGFATNLAALNGVGSMTSWAKQNHVTRQAVSKSTKWWQAELELLRSAHMKTKQACQRYAVAARGNHWRRQKYDSKKHGGGIRAGQDGGRGVDRLARPGGATSGKNHVRAVEVPA